MHILTPPFAALLLTLPLLTLTAPIPDPISPTALSSLTTSPFSKASKIISTSQQNPHKPIGKSYKTSTSNTFLDLDDALRSPTLTNKHHVLSQADGLGSLGLGRDDDQDATDVINPASWDDYAYTYKYNGADGTSTSTVRSNNLPALVDGEDGPSSVTVGNRNSREVGSESFDLDTDELVNSAISGERKGKGKKVGDVLRGWLPQTKRQKVQGLGRVVEETTSLEEGVGGGYDRKVPGLGRFVEETGDTLAGMGMEDGGYDSMEVEVGDGVGGFVWSDDEGQEGMGYGSEGGYGAGSEGGYDGGFASDGGHSDGYGSEGNYYSEGNGSGYEGQSEGGYSDGGYSDGGYSDGGNSDGGHSEGNGAEQSGCSTGNSNKVPAEYI